MHPILVTLLVIVGIIVALVAFIAYKNRALITEGVLKARDEAEQSDQERKL